MNDVASDALNPGSWRKPPRPRAVLRAAGVASGDTLDAARLSDLSRSHALTRVELPDGSAYVIKCVSQEAHDAGRSLAAELYTYRLASWRPDLAAVLPTVVHIDERQQVLVLDAAPSEHLFLARCVSTGFPDPDLGAALGRALAALHAATTGVPLLTVAACGIVGLPDAAERDWRLGDDSPAAVAIVRDVVADAQLAGSLRRTAAALRPVCLIHADVKWDNAVLDPGPPAHVRLFDWELSGRGDPAWDVGSALADSVSLVARLDGFATLAPDPVRWLSPVLQALLCAYDVPSAAGPSGDFAERVTGCWVARTIHLALECASSLEDRDHAVVRELLDLARRLTAHHDALRHAVADALCPAN